MSSDLGRIPEVLAVARRTLRVIRQNVLLSVAINVLAISSHRPGDRDAHLGAILHEASAMLVVLSAVRIVQWQPAAAA